jgi:hypothetical protein
MQNKKETFFIRQWLSFIIHDKLNKSISRALILNIALALLVIPSGICSQQHMTPFYNSVQLIFRETPTVCDVDDPVPLLLEQEYSASADANVPEPDAEPTQPPYDHYIMRAADAYQVDPTLIKAVIMAESSYNPRAVSYRGAKGLMQLMPGTAKSLGVAEPFDPALNIDGGVRYLRQLLDRFEGEVDLALAAYNAGSRYVRKYNGVPPFRATRQYIKKVLELQKKYQQETAADESSSSAV